MEIFGSYMGKDHTLAGEGVRICVLDTFVAIMAGLIIFPACFSYNVEVNAGPSLILLHCQMFLLICQVDAFGKLILFIYDICKLFYCDCCI